MAPVFLANCLCAFLHLFHLRFFFYIQTGIMCICILRRFVHIVLHLCFIMLHRCPCYPFHFALTFVYNLHTINIKTYPLCLACGSVCTAYSGKCRQKCQKYRIESVVFRFWNVYNCKHKKSKYFFKVAKSLRVWII